MNVPIDCSDIAVYPGDVVVGDSEGIVVIPGGLASHRRGGVVAGPI
jgi:regulator of RNase E activity RraA